MTTSVALAALNAAVALLNYRCYDRTREARDWWATVAWAGSCAYWLARGLVG